MFHPSDFEKQTTNSGDGSMSVTASSRKRTVLQGTSTRTALKGTFEKDVFTDLFFSAQNVDNIQKILKFVVHKYTGQVIDKQSPQEIIIVMRSVLLQNGTFPKEPVLITREIERLNDLVINELAPKVVSQLKQYLQYLVDSNNPTRSIANPINDSNAGNKGGASRSAADVFQGVQS